MKNEPIYIGDIEISPNCPDYGEIKQLQVSSMTPQEFSLKLRVAGWRYRKPGVVEQACSAIGLPAGEAMRRNRMEKSDRLDFFGRHLKHYVPLKKPHDQHAQKPLDQ